eukprot:Nitzschia sp. Nitz4//scaffold22_size323478//292603//293984//NITZ4_000588-RA/size323478-augustus-gene-0.214-mRNA-1//1//CDS//3329543180//597//frame0
MMEKDPKFADKLQLLSSTAMLKNDLEKSSSSSLKSLESADQLAPITKGPSPTMEVDHPNARPTPTPKNVPSPRRQSPSPANVVDIPNESPRSNTASIVVPPSVHRRSLFPIRESAPEVRPLGQINLPVHNDGRFAVHGFISRPSIHGASVPHQDGYYIPRATPPPCHSQYPYLPQGSFEERVVPPDSKASGGQQPKTMASFRFKENAPPMAFRRIHGDVHVIENTYVRAPGDSSGPPPAPTAISGPPSNMGMYPIQQIPSTTGLGAFRPINRAASEDERQDAATTGRPMSVNTYDALVRDNFHLRDQVREMESVIVAQQQRISQLENQNSELRQLPTGKISHIPIEDMLRIMEEYGSEVSKQTLPKRRDKIQKASVVRQFRRWNPEFFRYFIHVNGRWEPKLGKQGELKRRQEKRKEYKRNGAKEPESP